MRKTTLPDRSGASCLAATVCLLLAVGSLRADEQLGPMAATGGVLRDAEKRILAPASPAETKPAPEVRPAEDADALPKEMADRVIGPVGQVALLGSTDFAGREGVADAIRQELGDGDVTVGQIDAALAKVQGALLEKGFYLVRLSLAHKGAYDKDTRTLSVVVDEGRFGEINLSFEGEQEGKWFSREQMLRRFRSVTAGDTFDYGRLRTALFDANSHPDLTIDTSIDVRKPIEGEGASRRVARYADLTLDVHERVPLHAVMEVNNYGLKDVNEWQTSLTLQYLNLTKHDDVLTVSPAMSMGAELLSCAASYLLPHDWWLGGNTTVYGGWSSVEIDDIIPRLDLEGMGWFVGLQHSENIYKSDSHLLAVSAGILWRYIEDQYTVGSRSLNERGVHILPLTAALSYTGRKADVFGGRNFATVQGIFNVMNRGDDLDEMWNGADEDYWLFRCQVARLQPLFGSRTDDGDVRRNWQLFLKVEGQYTDQTLIPTEKLMLGGHNCLRGYRTRGYIGDYGIYGTAELRTPLLVDTFASLFGERKDKAAFDRMQFLTFCDWGVARYNNLPSGYDDNEFLCSVGLGARLAVTSHSEVRCDVAMPLRKGGNDDVRDVEAYCSFQVQF